MPPLLPCASTSVACACDPACAHNVRALQTTGEYSISWSDPWIVSGIVVYGLIFAVAVFRAVVQISHECKR